MLTSSKLLRVRCSVFACAHHDSYGVQVYARMLITCLTFALYSGHFTKSVNQGIAALKESGGDPDSAPMQKRYNYVVHSSHLFADCSVLDGNSSRSLKQTSNISPRSTLIVC